MTLPQIVRHGVWNLTLGLKALQYANGCSRACVSPYIAAKTTCTGFCGLLAMRCPPELACMHQRAFESAAVGTTGWQHLFLGAAESALPSVLQLAQKTHPPLP